MSTTATPRYRQQQQQHLTSYTVSYDSSSHWSVITQMWGSQWPKVLPYCLFNVALMVVLIVLDRRYGSDSNGYLNVVKASSQGHTFMSMVVAFLLVSRVNSGLTRYNLARDAIEIMYRETRELVQAATILSASSSRAGFNNNVDNHNSSDTAAAEVAAATAAREWRHEVAYRALILLRTAMVVIDYPVDFVAPWEIPELNGMELDDVKHNVYLSSNNRRWAHGERTIWEEGMRVPIRIAYLTRKSIHSQSKRLTEPIPVALENRLLANVDNFMGGYYGIRKFLTTPVPFPLIQMARTFVFLYVFTVPFVMLSDASSDLAHCVMVFLMTYGFVGLETVAIELDNPFGDDPNDFNCSALATTAFEDAYLIIRDVDGPDWTDKLRARMHDQTSDSNNDCASFVPTEQSRLLTTNV